MTQYDLATVQRVEARIRRGAVVCLAADGVLRVALWMLAREGREQEPPGRGSERRLP